MSYTLDVNSDLGYVNFKHSVFVARGVGTAIGFSGAEFRGV
jgi:hypothetical protein